MAPAPFLTIRFVRRPDGAVLFELRRADGTTTWQKRSGPTAEFFAVHDLTHYAVETTLGFHRAFYGLVAEGWELSDFGTPWHRGPLAAEALAAEVIVGCFDTQRAAHEQLLASQCNSSAQSYFAARDEPSPVYVTDDQLDRVRSVLSDLVWRWHSAGPGDSLVLTFPPAPAPASAPLATIR
jgi:hypothetical protein